jgi:hypothetical protein
MSLTEDSLGENTVYAKQIKKFTPYQQPDAYTAGLLRKITFKPLCELDSQKFLKRKHHTINKMTLISQHACGTEELSSG